MLKHALFSVPGQLSSKKRRSALQLKIDAWSPYDNTAYSVAWSGNDASVFAWDSDAMSARISDLGYDPARCDITPEAFLKEPSMNGVRLVNCSDGMEAQVWKNGFLKITRWWAAEPPKHEWSLFTRTSGLSNDAAPPGRQTPEWLELPWNEASLGSNVFIQAIRNDRFVVGGLAFLLAPCLFFASQWLTYSVLVAADTRTIATIEEKSRPVRADRMRALTALEEAEDIVSLNPYPHQIEIMSRAHNILSPFPVTLANWDYDEGTLEFGILSDADMDARVVITAFEEDAMFSSVSSSTVGQRLVMRMDVGMGVRQ